MRFSKLFSLIAVALLVAVVFAGLVSIPAAAQTDTMQFRYNAQHTGDYSAVAGSTPPNNVQKWNYTTYGSPSSPAIANGVVYIGGGSPPGKGVYALDAATGALKWSYTFGQTGSSPAVANGIVYIGANDGTLYALDASTGAKLWNFTTLHTFYSSPAVANGVIYIGCGDHNVYALNATTGAKLWNFTTQYDVISSPAVANGVVYVGSWAADHNVYALDAMTGKEKWNTTAGLYLESSPAVANGVVYIGGSVDGNLYALDAATGAKLWYFHTLWETFSSPAVANGVVYIGSRDKNLYAINASTGAKLWNYTTGGEVTSSPAVANGVVYIGGSEFSIHNDLYAINASTGAKLWNFTTGGGHSSPAVVNGVVYVGGNDGKVYAIGTQPEPTPTPTTLTATVSASVVAINKPFWVNGTLNATDGTPIAGATIQLQKNISGTWQNVIGKIDTTTSTGTYTISTSEPNVGTYQYRTTYAGGATYTGNNSTTVTVKVVSKASVQQDLVTLRTTLNKLHNSAFIPGTKSALLAVLNAAELQLKYNKYDGAASTLEKFLVRTDGCALRGTPDTADLVRTCAAQAQLYPQVLNLIQELQVLQGS